MQDELEEEEEDPPPLVEGWKGCRVFSSFLGPTHFIISVQKNFF